MHKGPRQLYQTLVKSPVGPSFGKPQILKHFVRLKKVLPVEATKKREIMRIQPITSIGLDHRGYLFTFMAHRRKIRELCRTSNLALSWAPSASFIRPAPEAGRPLDQGVDKPKSLRDQLL